MSKTVEHKLNEEYKQLEAQVIGILLTMLMAVILTLGTSMMFQFLVLVAVVIEVFLLDYKYYTSTIWTVMYNSANDLGLTCVQCGYDYHCNCKSCKKRREDVTKVGWKRLECEEYDCGEECPKCGTQYSSGFLEDLSYEIYERSKINSVTSA